MYKKGFILALQIALRLGYMVLVPLVIFGGVGLWVDRRFGTLPSFLLIGIVIAFASTTFWIKRQVRKIIEVIQ